MQNGVSDCKRETIDTFTLRTFLFRTMSEGYGPNPRAFGAKISVSDVKNHFNYVKI